MSLSAMLLHGITSEVAEDDTCAVTGTTASEDEQLVAEADSDVLPC